MKKGYKKTEIGVIPEEWRVVSTEEILTNDKGAIKIGPFGSQLKKEYLVDNGYKVYGQENVFKNDFKIGSRYIDDERYQALKSSELISGDLVISMMGTVGKTSIVPNDIESGIMDSHLIRLRVDETQYNKELMMQMIQNSSLITKQIKKLSVGGIMEGLSSTIIKQLKFPLIDLKEQEKIAETLSTVDCQIDGTEILIEKCKMLKKGLMQRLLTKGIGHKEFKKCEVGEIPAEWEVRKLKDISSRIGDGLHGTPEYKEDGEFYFINGNNISNRKIEVYENTKKVDESEYIKYKKELNANSILISLNGTIGNLGFYNNEKVMLGKSSGYINLSQGTNKLFIYYQLCSDRVQNHFLKELTGTTIKNLSLNTLRETKITIPSEKEQEQIAQILLSVDNEIEEHENKKQRLEELKKGLMQQLLTGKIRTL